MDPLSRASALLPFWARYGGTLILGALAVGLPALICAIAYRAGRPPADPDPHWTERARSYWSGAMVLNGTLFGGVLSLAITAGLLHGPLSPVGAGAMILGAGICMLLATRIAAARHRRRYFPRVDGSTARRGGWTRGLILNSPLYATLLFAILLPADPGPLFFAVLIPALAIVVFLVMGGGVHLAAGLGLLRPAPEPVAAAVAAAAEERGLPPPRVVVGELGMANAWALPFANLVLVTKRTVEVLSPEEFRALADHEVAHLAEPGRVRAMRLVGRSIYLVLLGFRPLIAHLGIVGYLGLVLLAWLVLIHALRSSRRLEEDADHHAIHARGGGGEVVYARGLEKIYRENLSPAVLKRKIATHPDLYDRLLAAGLTPDYPRPEPPPRRRGLIRGLLLLAMAAPIALVLLQATAHPDRAATEAEVLEDILLTGGGSRDLASLARFRLERGDAAAAATYLRAAEELSPRWPEYPAKSARALARVGDQAGARRALARAEQLLEAFPPRSRAFFAEEMSAARRELDLAFPPPRPR